MNRTAQPIEGLAGLVLAAGQSSRLGQPKQLLEHDGKPLIGKAIETIQGVCGGPMVVVTGAAAAEVEAVVAGYPVRIARNNDWASGMAGSIAAGMAALADTDSSAVLIMLSDQPRVSSADIERLARIWQNSPSHIAAAAYQDTIGVPAIFPATDFAGLAALKGDIGARAFIQSGTDVTAVEMEAAGFDIDTAADWQEFQRS